MDAAGTAEEEEEEEDKRTSARGRRRPAVVAAATRRAKSMVFGLLVCCCVSLLRTEGIGRGRGKDDEMCPYEKGNEGCSGRVWRIRDDARAFGNRITGCVFINEPSDKRPC